MYLVLSCK